MSDNSPIITISSNGPISINGEVVLINENGNEIEHKSRFSLCKCTKSKRLPFCDGSHKN
ncbi:MAG: CDGSH iron-sulfur domain-containing protein [Bacteroidota bacterium]|nr:CDGSH iron-sulfur domain-containing protein [Bacteroidota bacterium]